MNKRIQELAEQAYEQEPLMVINPKTHEPEHRISKDGVTMYYKVFNREKFAELIVRECIGILETEIELVKGYKSTACDDFDVRWHQGKIEHFAKLVEKSKKHFGVDE
jgi:hypothetical protein